MTLPEIRPEDDVYDEMEVLIHLAASTVRSLIAAITGGRAATAFSPEELTEIALTLGGKFLKDYEALDRRLEERER